MNRAIPVSRSYSGRTVDLLMFDINSDIATGPVTLSFSDNPKICTGIQKVSQIFESTLFTELGSILADKTYGIDGVGQIGITNVRSEYTKQVFELAVFDSLAAMKEEQEALAAAGTVLPLDEILTNAEILDLSVVKDKVNLNVKLTTAAGTTRVLILPTTNAMGS